MFQTGCHQRFTGRPDWGWEGEEIARGRLGGPQGGYGGKEWQLFTGPHHTQHALHALPAQTDTPTLLSSLTTANSFTLTQTQTHSFLLVLVLFFFFFFFFLPPPPPPPKPTAIP